MCVLQSITATEGLVLDIRLQLSRCGELLTAGSETEEEKKRLGLRSPGRDRGALALLPSICCL